MKLFFPLRSWQGSEKTCVEEVRNTISKCWETQVNCPQWQPIFSDCGSFIMLVWNATPNHWRWKNTCILSINASLNILLSGNLCFTVEESTHKYSGSWVHCPECSKTVNYGSLRGPLQGLWTFQHIQTPHKSLFSGSTLQIQINTQSMR